MKILTRRISPRAAIAVGVLALLASLVSGREKPDLPVRAVEAGSRPAESLAEFDLDKRKQPVRSQAVADPFATPPPPAAAAAPEQKPAAPAPPPLPFRYLGRASEEGRVAVFLGRGNENYSVARGEQAGRDYRVEQITDAAVTLTYLPLGQQQVLPLPALN